MRRHTGLRSDRNVIPLVLCLISCLVHHERPLRPKLDRSRGLDRRTHPVVKTEELKIEIKYETAKGKLKRSRNRRHYNKKAR